MIEIIIRVNTDNIFGVKETLAEYLEKYGDTRVVYVKELPQAEQMKIGKEARA